MQEYGLSVLEQYHIEIISTRKIRGAVLCEAKEGLFLLKEVHVGKQRIPVIHELYELLEAQGYDTVDSIVKNQDGECESSLENGGRYLLKRWYAGRECDVRRPAELLEASGNLAKLHLLMCHELSGPVMHAEDMSEEYMRHNRELMKVRRFIRGNALKGEFEHGFLGCFDRMYSWAEAAGELLRQSDYEKLYQKSIDNSCMVHGEYNYHNIMMKSAGREYPSSAMTIAAITNFDKFKKNVQVEDLYYFLRKVMEKHGWKERLGDNMLNAYSAIKPLTAEETEYLKLRLVYPEKFWKVADSYYHSNKAWMPVKNIEKLNTAIRQTKEKERFLDNIFAFHLDRPVV